MNAALAMHRERLLDLLLARQLRAAAELWLARALTCGWPSESHTESELFERALRAERIAYLVERGLVSFHPIQAEGWR